MKLWNQALTIFTVTGIIFLLVTLFLPIRLNLIIFIPVTIIALLGALGLIRKYIIRRVENLNQQVSAIEPSNPEERINMDGNDEVTSIAMQVNKMLDTIKANSVNLDQIIEEKTHELQSQNHKLKSEISRQITEEHQPNANKEYLAKISHYDSLTSLPNRVFFNEILYKAMSHASRYEKILAVLLVDLDHFSKVHASLGQDKCDIVIKEIGRRFANVLRTEDIMAKLEGDEFIILLNDINKTKFASTVATKLLQVCSHPMKIDDNEFSLTASIGISVFPDDGFSLEDLLKNADSALFKAKSSGGNNFQYASHTMDVESREYLQLESALRNAMQNNELVLYYQPKFSVRKGTIAGVEALIRWEHPVLGILGPSKFIPLAEETGLIMQIGEWAIREACRVTKFWQDEGYEHITVSLNLSPKQFHHPDIAKIIANSLKITGLNPKYLELEISETTVMQNIDLAQSILDNIHLTGAQIALDHFGTGYTSISSLKFFPVNTVKIDQSFIKGVPTIPNDMALTTALIALAHNLGFEIVAQGVETPDQVQFLASQNCDLIQGYFLSHPQPAQKVVLQFKKLMEEAII